MGHGIVQQDERHARYFGEAAWHKLGEVFQGEESPTECLRKADAAFGIEKVQVSVPNAEGVHVPVENQFLLYRDNDFARSRVLSPSTVTEQYTPVCPLDLARLADPWYEAGYATTDAFFVLDNGQREVLSLRLKDIPGPDRDDSSYETFFCFANSHARGAVQGTVVRHRVVCRNTTPTFHDWKIRHKSSVHERMKYAVATWTQAREAIARWNSDYDRLAAKTVDIPSTVDQLLGINAEALTAFKGGTRTLGGLSPQKVEQRDRIIAAASTAPGTEGKTLADLYNGMTYLATYGSLGGRKANNSGLFGFGGSQDSLLASAFDSMLAMA